MTESFNREEEKPPSRHMKRYWKIAILANIKEDDHPKPEGVPPDAFADFDHIETCLLYTSPSPRDRTRSRMPSSA